MRPEGVGGPLSVLMCNEIDLVMRMTSNIQDWE